MTEIMKQHPAPWTHDNGASVINAVEINDRDHTRVMLIFHGGGVPGATPRLSQADATALADSIIATANGGGWDKRIEWQAKFKATGALAPSAAGSVPHTIPDTAVSGRRGSMTYNGLQVYDQLFDYAQADAWRRVNRPSTVLRPILSKRTAKASRRDYYIIAYALVPVGAHAASGGAVLTLSQKSDTGAIYKSRVLSLVECEVFGILDASVGPKIYPWMVGKGPVPAGTVSTPVRHVTAVRGLAGGVGGVTVVSGGDSPTPTDDRIGFADTGAPTDPFEAALDRALRKDG